jgi:hypothetical protein
MLMQQFEIVLKNDKIKSYRFIALFLVLLNLAIFIFFLFAKIYFYEASVALLLLGLYIIYQLYNAKKNHTTFYINEITFFILAGSWIALQNYFAALACVLVGVLYHLSLQKLTFVFNNNYIKRMNFPQAEYSWNTMSNVILKDNILTIDFNNNKLIQAEIENAVNETEFNEFVQIKIHN